MENVDVVKLVVTQKDGLFGGKIVEAKAYSPEGEKVLYEINDVETENLVLHILDNYCEERNWKVRMYSMETEKAKLSEEELDLVKLAHTSGG